MSRSIEIVLADSGSITLFKVVVNKVKTHFGKRNC